MSQNTKKRITIKEIALETGISAQAVSRAMRDMPDISNETKARVNEVARRLGYIRNKTASSLRQGKTNNIGVIFDNLANPYFSIMTMHIHEALKVLGYSLVILTSENGRFDTETFELIMSQNLDGAISFLEPDWQIEELVERYKTPVIVLGRKATGKIDFIRTNDKKGGKLAARKLIDSGCRKILHITEKLDIGCACERFEGFKEELTNENLYDDSLVISLEGRYLSHVIEDLIIKKVSFDGIFMFNDVLALEAIYTLEQCKIFNIKIVGYDNIQDNLKLPRRLTTIGFDKKGMVQEAVNILVNKIENGINNTFQEKIHDVFLVQGETT